MSTHAEHTQEQIHEPAPTPAHGGHEAHDAHQAAGAHAGHGGHGGHADHVGQFRRLFWWNLLLALPVIGFSTMFAMILGYELPGIPGIEWISPALGTVIYVGGGRPFITAPVVHLKARKPGMMLLIALAFTIAFLSSMGAS